MLTVDGRQVVFQVSFILSSDSVATVDLPINPSVIAKFKVLPPPDDLHDTSLKAKSERFNSEQNVETKVDGRTITFLLPYLREHVSNVTPLFDFGGTDRDKISARIGRQSLSGAMLVNFQLYGNRIIDPPL